MYCKWIKYWRVSLKSNYSRIFTQGAQYQFTQLFSWNPIKSSSILNFPLTHLTHNLRARGRRDMSDVALFVEVTGPDTTSNRPPRRRGVLGLIKLLCRTSCNAWHLSLWDQSSQILWEMLWYFPVDSLSWNECFTMVALSDLRLLEQHFWLLHAQPAIGAMT